MATRLGGMSSRDFSKTSIPSYWSISRRNDYTTNFSPQSFNSPTRDRTERNVVRDHGTLSPGSSLPSSPEKDEDFKLSTLRSLISIAEELKTIDLEEALSTYQGLMRKTHNEDELRREEKHIQQQKRREAERGRYDHADILKEKKALEETKEKNENLEKEVEKLKDELTMLQSKYDSMETRHRYDASETQIKLQEMKKELDTALKDKNEALTRLSKEMGTKLNDDNPTIADLSDPNRATKIAEKYSELYDNQWTDAMESLNGTLSEEEGIQTLLNVLKECYQICEETAQQQMEHLQTTLRIPCSQNSYHRSPSRSSDRIAKTANKLLKDSRKLMADEAMTDVVQKVMEGSSSRMKLVDWNFVKRCVELCWMMNVQDPPVVLGKEATKGDIFDQDYYREYTATGKVVEYTVWLPLLLHKDGPLLSKGVAQPVKIKRIKSAPASSRVKSKPFEAHSPPAGRDTQSAKSSRGWKDKRDESASGYSVGTGVYVNNYETEVVRPRQDKNTNRAVVKATTVYDKSPKQTTSEYMKYVTLYDRVGKAYAFYTLQVDGDLYIEYQSKLHKYESFKQRYGLTSARL